MYRKLSVVLALGAAAFLSAAESPNDYAYGAEIYNPYSSEAVIRLALSDEVYLKSTSENLYDVRVFDAKGQVVPIAFIDAKEREYSTNKTELTIFQTDAYIDNTSSRAIYNYKYFVKAPEGFDAKHLEKFEFKWEKSAQNWEARVDIYRESKKGGGKTTVSRYAKISDYKDRNGDDEYIQNSVSIDDNGKLGSNDGWQITLTSNTPVPKLTKVTAHSEQLGERQQYVVFNPHKANSSKESVVYSLPSAQPISRLFINIMKKGAILPLSISYRSDNTSQFRPIKSEVLRESSYVELGGVLAKEFKFEATDGSYDMGFIMVEMYRKRSDLLINSADRGDLMLVWGRADDVSETAISYSDMLGNESLENVPYASISGSFVLGGEKALVKTQSDEKSPAVPKWVIWAVLIAGVAFLGFLAFKLSREMTKK